MRAPLRRLVASGLFALLAWSADALHLAPALAYAQPATAAQPPARHDSGAASATRIRQASFCETGQPFDATGCAWQQVTLPHRWQPAGPSPSWGLYRLTWPSPAGGAFGLITDHLSLYGMARSGKETVVPAAIGQDRMVHLRYWPQLFVFQPEPGEPGRIVQVDIAVRGHPQAKNGLGGAVFAPLQVAQEWHLREVLLEVVLVLAVAAASLMAGLIGIFAGDRRSLADRLLRLVSLLAVAAGLRSAMNFVVLPWLPWPAWHAVGLWMLAAIGVLASVTLATCLRPQDRRIVPAAVAGLAGLGMLLALVPGASRFALSEVVFGALVLLTCALVAVLGWRSVRTPEPLGLTLLVPILLVMLGGAHDLALHLGSGSLSDRYLQKWSTPGLLVLLIVLLGRSAAAQRRVEQALQRETVRRHELLRDLHDGIGSRLVALAYHARQKPEHGSFAEEIDRLIHELQLIQGAVRADATTLERLVAELRHLYARVGGGSLPIDWEVSDLPFPCRLTAEQAVATARIVEEAVANAVKHARPTRITVALCTAEEPYAAELSIGDDGGGRFEEGAGAGLRHMRLRAEHAGLWLDLAQPGPGSAGKAVRLRFPLDRPARGWFSRLGARLRGAQPGSLGSD